MVQREDVPASIELMQEISETLRETYLLRKAAIEEEIMVEAQNINKIFNNALRIAKHILSHNLGFETRQNRRCCVLNHAHK